ncbi:MAG TPA: RNA polymerase sigma factor [Baekduia sp.]|uniref:RNA polymerase sigma factor n=1 Tax=Baekduia sp. TaxID=2600305 RepID=UPI002C26F30C|nr:RNA polymerase sigma factor [Baekduia sp.]HMJ36846.1 RNA polymerase sigma factor [Baekduia sp.]
MLQADHDAAAQPSDAAILAASVGDPHAFTALFERHFARIHGWLHRRVGAPLAEDLAAETFTRAFDQRERFDGAYADARPWLFGIAARLVHDHHRAELRRLRALARVECWEAVGDDVAAGAVARADAAAAGPAVAAALAALRDEERDVLLLVAWAGLEYDEVARATGVPIGTVRSRLHRARRRLRATLELPEETA